MQAGRHLGKTYTCYIWSASCHRTGCDQLISRFGWLHPRWPGNVHRWPVVQDAALLDIAVTRQHRTYSRVWSE